MHDIIKTMHRLTPQDVKHLQVHLVETSPNLAKIQDAKLRRFQEDISSIKVVFSEIFGCSFFGPA